MTIIKSFFSIVMTVVATVTYSLIVLPSYVVAADTYVKYTYNFTADTSGNNGTIYLGTPTWPSSKTENDINVPIPVPPDVVKGLAEVTSVDLEMHDHDEDGGFSFYVTRLDGEEKDVERDQDVSTLRIDGNANVLCGRESQINTLVNPTHNGKDFVKLQYGGEDECYEVHHLELKASDGENKIKSARIKFECLDKSGDDNDMFNDCENYNQMHWHIRNVTWNVKYTDTNTTGQVCGTVTTTAGKPVTNLTVKVKDQNNQNRVVTTDNSGRFNVADFIYNNELYDVVLPNNESNTTPAGLLGLGKTSGEGWNWDWRKNPIPNTVPWADIPVGSLAYTGQKMNSGIDCSGPGRNNEVCRCSFIYEEKIPPLPVNLSCSTSCVDPTTGDTNDKMTFNWTWSGDTNANWVFNFAPTATANWGNNFWNYYPVTGKQLSINSNITNNLAFLGNSNNKNFGAMKVGVPYSAYIWWAGADGTTELPNYRSNDTTCTLVYCGEETTPLISGNIYQVASIDTPCSQANSIRFQDGELGSFKVSSIPTPLNNIMTQNLLTKSFSFNTQPANSSINHKLSLVINDLNFQCANSNPADRSGNCITNINPRGSNVTQNFCVYKSSSPPTSKSISGNFYLTTDSNSCTDKSTLVNLKDTTSITSNPSLPITYEAAGTGYSLSTSAEGAHTVTLDLESSGYACACNEVDPGVCKISADPGDTDADFIVFDAAASAEPWWQVWGGLVYGHNNIHSDLPIYSTACEESSTCEPYLITAPTSNDKSAGIPITRLDNIMKNIRGYLTQHPGNGSTPYALNSDMKTGQTTENFLYFSEKVDINGIHEISSESISSLPPGTVRGTGLGQALVSKRVGNLTVRPIDTITVTGKHIIFVTGNLKFEQGGTLEHLIEVPEGNFLAFVVSGDVTIDGTVGNTNKSDTTSNIEAVIVADGIITVDSGNKRCVAEGSYVGWSGIVFKRVFDDNADHLITPTELFIHRPDFVTNAPDILKETTLNWQEVN